MQFDVEMLHAVGYIGTLSSTVPSCCIFSDVCFWRWFVYDESVNLVLILQPDQGGNPETEVQ